MASTNATTASGSKNRDIPPRDTRPTKKPAKIKSISKIAIFYSIVVKNITQKKMALLAIMVVDI